MRWCVVMRDLNTTTQLVLVVLSNRESASWGMLTFISFVQWIKSGKQEKEWRDVTLVAIRPVTFRSVAVINKQINTKKN